MKEPKYGNASELWQKYRDTYAIYKAEQYAKFTIPSLMVDPLRGHKGASADGIEHDFQSVGAFLVNNLASKIVSALFPANMPYFKLELSPELEEAAADEGVSTSELQGRLSELERDSTKQVFLHGGQHKLTRAVKLLIVAGDCLIYRDSVTKKFVVWTRHSFSVKRDAMGDLDTIVLKQRFDWAELSEDLQKDLRKKTHKVYEDDSTVELYTVIKTVQGTPNNTVQVWHEVDSVQVGETAEYAEHLSPYIVPAWNLADGENYARGLIEEYAGDFARLSLVTEQLGLYELDSLKMLNLVDESAGGVVDDYQEAESGDYVPGKANAVQAVESGDYNKMAAINNSISSVVQRLSQAFMFTGNQRDSERTTATEVQYVAREADTTLGGVYSLLAESMQAPLAYLSIAETVQGNRGMLLGLLARNFKPSITTGIPAMSRSADTVNLMQATQEAAAVVPALSEISNRFDLDKVVEKIFQGNSVNIEEISKSPEQLAEEAEQERQAAMATEQATTAAASGDAQEMQEAIQEIR